MKGQPTSPVDRILTPHDQAFTVVSLTFLTVFINALLSLYRARIQPPPAHPAHAPPYVAAPYHFLGAPQPEWARPSWRKGEEGRGRGGGAVEEEAD